MSDAEDRERIVTKRAELYITLATEADPLASIEVIRAFDEEHQVTAAEEEESRTQAINFALGLLKNTAPPIPTYINFAYRHQGCCSRNGEEVTIGAPVVDGTYMREVVRCAASHAELALVSIDGVPVQ